MLIFISMEWIQVKCWDAVEHDRNVDVIGGLEQEVRFCCLFCCQCGSHRPVLQYTSFFQGFGLAFFSQIFPEEPAPVPSSSPEICHSDVHAPATGTAAPHTEWCWIKHFSELLHIIINPSVKDGAREVKSRANLITKQNQLANLTPWAKHSPWTLMPAQCSHVSHDSCSSYTRTYRLCTLFACYIRANCMTLYWHLPWCYSKSNSLQTMHILYNCTIHMFIPVCEICTVCVLCAEGSTVGGHRQPQCVCSFLDAWAYFPRLLPNLHSAHKLWSGHSLLSHKQGHSSAGSEHVPLY